MTVSNCTYSKEGLQGLGDEIESKLAKVTNRYHSSVKFDLGGKLPEDILIKLKHYTDMLVRIENCDSCFSDYTLSDIVSVIKNTLNKI